jgi:3-hydroxyisobutyrate dehydrogenase
VASPLLDICHSLYAEADALGEKDLDIVAVVLAIEQRAAALVVETA